MTILTGRKNYGIKELRLKGELDGNLAPSDKEAPIIIPVREYLGVGFNDKLNFELSGFHENQPNEFEVNYKVELYGQTKSGTISGTVIETEENKYVFSLTTID